MATRIRTLNFLPEIFKTSTNSQFLKATLDQIVDQPNLERIQGYVGSKLGYGINAKSNYVTEPTKTRTDYQLDPGVVFLKKGTETSQDFISYPGIIDALSLEGGITNNNNRLFNSQFYSWDSFTDLDKIINFNQYYWLPEGPARVNVSTATVFNASAYIVTDVVNGYNITVDGQAQGVTNPTITLLRGGTYTFAVNQNSQFWIQGEPGVTGFSPSQPNLQTRDVYGVDNNGAMHGFVTFNVPPKTAQDEYNFPGNNLVDVVSTLPYDQINGKLVSELAGIDGVTALNGLTLMFYDTGVVSEQGFISTFYDTTTFDQIDPALVDGFGSYDGGYYTDVSATFYTITYIGDPGNQTIRLVEATSIPTNQKITASFGTQWISRNFYRNTSGTIMLIPYLSAILDTLYYQDGTTANKVGQIKIIDSNVTNTLNILTEVLGKKTLTSSAGVVFTNGLLVVFSGDVYPASYKNIPFYVEGVGTSIELVKADDLIAPELFSASGAEIPFDTLAYDIGNFESNLYVPVTPDYITIARNALNRNAWSRSNRWFHIDVINATAEYNSNPDLVSLYATAANKAKRPIIEFYPNLRMFDSGVVGKAPIDFIDFRTTDAFSLVAGQQQYYPDIGVYTTYTGTIVGVTGATTTTLNIASANVTGTFQVGQYITDSTNLLPRNTYITDITGTTTLTITVAWSEVATFGSTAVASFVASDATTDSYALFEGARVVFAGDDRLEVRNKIYVAHFSSITPTSTPVITLTETTDGEIFEDNQTVSFRGYANTGKSFYFTGTTWLHSQLKLTVNQPPLFDIFDNNGISFGNLDYYIGTSFTGTQLLAYGIGSGLDDVILGFPLRYSAVDNVGDISFDVSLNTDTFNYVQGSAPVTQKINTGYVYNYSSLTEHVRQLGWQTALAPSVQYQIFEFQYLASAPTNTFICDVVVNVADGGWPVMQLYVNNVLQPAGSYTTTTTATTTVVSFTPNTLVDTVVQILLLSDQVSTTAYYGIPTNLNNNPLNADVTTVNVGDIRRQYQSIFQNNVNITGTMLGSNNYRDSGNVVPYGSSIIQNSASLVLPGAFLRNQNHNLFNSLLFNSREYITFKTLLVNTVNSTEYSVYQSAASMLDEAIDQITAAKTDSNSFFWSDMLPTKAAYISNSYSFTNSLDTSNFSLSRVYDFSQANYYGVLVYLTRTTNNLTQVTQLVLNVDYTLSSTAPSLTIQLNLLPGDLINIKEYNQTYGSYVPNTPTKLGLYPSTIPSVTLDSNYMQPTYFIVGHDGSYNKLYGDYDPVTGRLIDFRDQVLLEFEKRIYNNLKISAEIPIKEYEVLPGFFRDTSYSYDEILRIYSESFLNWVGQNRIDYKTQSYSSSDQFTYNYYQSGNKINEAVIQPGYWRGVYEYFYDTSNPDTAPWEMLGFTNQPTWWETVYGPAPYTSDNLVLWTDLAEGINWNNGAPVVITQAIRPQLLQVIPVDTAGNLVSPFVSVVGGYAEYAFKNDWKVGDAGPAEFSYRRSSSWPFDLMRILALTKPAEFFNLGVDADNYKYNEEFGQYLVNNRSHLKLSDIEVYGSGTPKTSYINWIVDFEKQVGVDATQNILDLFSNIDVRLVYRLAGFSDKNMLKFYVEKGTPNSNNSSLLIPDESYSVLLYDNQPFKRIVYSSVVVQITTRGYKVYGNSQTGAYFSVLKPKINGNYSNVSVEKLTVQLANDYFDTVVVIPYGTEFLSVQEVSQFLESYGRYLMSQGAVFDQIESGLEINWRQMVAEFAYWAQIGWEVGSIVNINPAATQLTIDKDSNIVQPLTLHQQNFVLNQNLYPISSTDLSVVRDGTLFTATPLNPNDTISYGQFNISNFEHGIVFDNVTLFDDSIYNLTTGLRQSRIVVKGTKTAEWNGTIDAQGFILNQDNIQEWSKEVKYTTGSVVKYKNKYWVAIKIVQAAETFDEQYWKQTNYDEIQKGLLPNPSTRSYESTLYYDVNQANLENDADLLSFSLIGYRPRDYMAIADLTDITQVNVYKNLIKNKGTLNAASVFRGAQLSQGGIDYDIYENWAIKSGEFGGVLNSNFVEFRLSESMLTGNPSIVGLTSDQNTAGVQQEIPMYSLYNYGRAVTNPNVLPLSDGAPSSVFPDAGYVNFNDVKMSSYYYSGLTSAVDSAGIIVPLTDLYVRDYVWIANQQGTWQTYTPASLGQVTYAKNNLNGTVTITFKQLHNLSKYQSFAVVNFNENIDGYYTVAVVVDPYSVTISLNLDPSITAVAGLGTGFKFQSQRVATPSEISTLPLIDSEFTKNKVWVDTNADGNWAVYRKSINYTIDIPILGAQSVVPPLKVPPETFGSAVAYTTLLGYLISDASVGQAYRYTYNALTLRYDLVGTLPMSTDPIPVPVERPSFGAAISYAGDIFAISEPTGGTAAVLIYKLFSTTTNDDLALQQTILAPAGATNWGSATAISGDQNWLYVSDIVNNSVHVYRRSSLTSLYEPSHIIDGDALTLTTAGDNFGYSLSTDYCGDTVVIGTPGQNIDALDNWGYTYVFKRTTQNIEAQYNTLSPAPQVFTLAWTPDTISTVATATAVTTNLITCNSTVDFAVDMPVIFSGTLLVDCGISADKVYYIKDITLPLDGTFTISETRGGTVVDLVNQSGLMTVTVQSTPLFVSLAGTLLADDSYAVIDTSLVVISYLTAGDIVNVSGNNFSMIQTLTTETTPRTGVQFGISVDTTTYASEIIVGAPFELNSQQTNNQNIEGAVYRFTNGSAKYGIITGSVDCTITAPITILINGYMVVLPAGNATLAAKAINNAHITNVVATAADNKLTIQLIYLSLATPNDKLVLTVLDQTSLAQLGMTIYTQTQVINDPHIGGRTQFGAVVKFNEFGSFVTSAPTGIRYAATTFDFTDNEADNDTLFDNNTTQWIDTFTNAGAVYMFDYVSEYGESLNNIGKFVYAQSVNDTSIDYGSQPMYGQALEFNAGRVVVGTPNFRPGQSNGQVVSYTNATSEQDWSVYRSSAPIVDINRIQDIQMYSALTNTTLDNLDYIDPLQGKILGSAQENIDVISNQDPAGYNSINRSGSVVWAAAKVGQLWFNTSTSRFVNYHQDNVVYNSKYWGRVFPGSNVTVYSWISSNTLPSQYVGPGTPFDITSYTTEYVLSLTGALQPVFFFWVRNTNVIFTKAGKTLSDTVIESYIANPIGSGISYFAPLLPSAFALYNSYENINDNDTVLHIGFSTGTNDNVSHNLFSLIRAGYADDFLPGFPGTGPITIPESLYSRMLCSMCGVDDSGSVVPDPYLPKPVQYGIMARPNQSFFINRFGALKNYLTYANEILAQYPITETRQTTSLTLGNTRDYWNYVNWWSTGYNDNTKSILQVGMYADLSAIVATEGMIVTVTANGAGKAETYVYTSTGTWSRIGLQNGTVEFSSVLWDYETARLGFGDNFFDTTPYDSYPSLETKNIIRSLNEEIYTDDLLIHRNKSLVLVFEYVQSETIESQNYLPWLNKTSFIDVAHTIRELLPIPVYQSDNQDFLSGYLNEVKPYHVVIKEFLFKYTGTDVFEGDVSDFDVPATYNSEVEGFVSPQLVYQNAMVNQYLPSDPIWQTAPYNSWFNNYGLSITGVPDYQITSTASYIALNSAAFAVVNANGFPVNGVIRIDSELIGYSSVDRAMSVISGLTRGVNGTEVVTHLPGTLIYMDLPAVLLLDSGRGYSDPPKVVAYIDTSIYPEPTRPAVLSAVMSLDSVLRVDVIDPGQGYAVLPSIIIDPSFQLKFDSDAVSSVSNTISLSAPLLQTGDLVRYVVGPNTTAVGGLSDGQYYYVNVLESSPSFVVALYLKYSDAIGDQVRVALFNQGTGSNNYLYVSARASCVSTAVPVRENNISLRFDRTTYSSPVMNWAARAFYGSFFAGFLNESNKISSSYISLQSSQPPIDSILASSQGAVFEISTVNSLDTLTWSSRTRTVINTTTGTNVIRITPSDGGSPISVDQPIGSTLGFYIGMPVKFEGAVFGTDLASDTVYYVKSLVDLDDGLGNMEPTGFTVSDSIVGDVPGPVFPLSTATIGAAGLKCLVGQTTSTAVVSIDYPGILQVTQTTAGTNNVTSPLNSNGHGGTSGFYVGIPVFFVGDVFGGIIANETYYVTTVVDEETFTMSKTADPVMITVTDTTASTDLITCESTLLLSVNDPVIFTGATYGNIVAGTTYYVSAITSDTEFSVSLVINGGNFALSDDFGTMIVTNQNATFDLTTASGAMTLNVGLPISPGQITGQQFTFYPTGGIIASGVSGTDGNLVTRTIVNAISGTEPTGDYLTVSDATGGLTDIYIGLPIEFASIYAGFSAATTYFVTGSGTVSTTVTYSSTATDEFTCDSTNGFYAGMPIVPSVMPMGGLDLAASYFVYDVIDSTHFRVSTTWPAAAQLTLTTTSGLMTVTGTPWIRLDTPVVSDSSASVTITQAPTLAPSFDVGFMLGGYYVVIVTPGEGYTINNTITIPGHIPGFPTGSTTPTNDLVITVDMIDAIVANPNPILLPIQSAGTIMSVNCAGTPFETTNQYYLKVITATDCEVYYDSLLSQPVAGVDFMYNPADFVFLPEPFFFDQSIVRFNHQLYRCIISNNDDEFIFGKWELLSSGAREINALDRIVGYYQPTINMPGLDMTQLVSGITYPNSTYLGNAFAPADEFELDTLLQDKPFYPTEVNINAVVWDGTNFVAPSSTTGYSAVISSPTGANWTIGKLSNQPINPTDIAFSGTKYVMTTTNRATPILTSVDGVIWSATLDVPSYLLNSVTYLNGTYVAVGDKVITGSDTADWHVTYAFGSPSLTNTFKGVAAISLPYFTGFIAVGMGQQYTYPVGGITTVVDISVLMWSPDGLSWNNLVSPLTNVSLNAVCQCADRIVVVGDAGAKFTSTNGVSWVNISAGANNLDDVACADSLSLLVAVGESGKIETSDDAGATWIEQTSGTAENLHGVTWNDVDSEFVAVGDNNTILISVDGVTWTSTSIFITDPTVYDIQDDSFTAGYGPEELVPGVISDNLNILVTTRPGTNWTAAEYGYIGYSVVSLEMSPTSGAQVAYSFDNICPVPAQVSVSIVDGVTGMSTTIYQPAYSVNWLTKTVVLASPLSFISVGNSDRLRVDVYEVGNGDQLVKSNTQSDPIINDPITGFDQIELNCNYSAPVYAGSGVIRPGTAPVEVTATATYAAINSILCESVADFSLNDSVTFQGSVFGNVATLTTYFVKTISYVTNMITISETLPSGIAGPTFALADDTGSMQVLTQVGSGAVWTDPIVYHNGDKLIIGSTNIVSATHTGTDVIECNSTAGVYADDPIVFDSRIFGGIVPHQMYYVKAIVSAYEFTISETMGGAVFALVNGTGVSTFIAHDYAFGISSNELSANLVFSGMHTAETMFITYAVFGETTPQQYGYTIPETSTFVVSVAETVFVMTNYVAGDNPKNAVVEYNGLRLIETTDYVLDPEANTLTLLFATSPGDTVSVTSFNLTDRQYLHTSYGDPLSTATVANIVGVDNAITTPLASTYATATTVTVDEITVDSALGFVVGQRVIFKGVAFGGIDTAGTVYYVKTVTLPSTFTMSSLPDLSDTVSLSTATGFIAVYVGGNPAVTVTTGVPHNLPNLNSNLIRIDGTTGSTQLNNELFYAKIINANQLALYSTPYDPALTAINNPITSVSSYLVGGYVWAEGIFTIQTTAASDTTAITNVITVLSTNELVVGTQIIFTGTTFGGLVAGTTYYVNSIVSVIDFTVSESYQGAIFELTTDSGTMGVTQWEQTNVDRLWVTVNGYRVPSSSLYLNPDNNLSILTTIVPGDIVTVTSMMPTATPNQIVFMEQVNKTGQGSVYRANNQTRTWITASVTDTDSVIYVNDILRLTNTIVQSVIAPAAGIDGVISIGLTVDKRIISNIVVYNNTTGNVVLPSNYSEGIVNLSPMLLITGQVTAGDSLTITILEGNLLYLNGEQIRFSSVDLVTNSISGLQRGANGTGVREFTPASTQIYGLLSKNRMSDLLYNNTWNEHDYPDFDGDVDGGPLQVSTTPGALFLLTGVDQ